MENPKSTGDTSNRAEANRQNSQKSTGPKTAVGKRRSRFNALKHGMRAKQAVLPGEDPAAFQARLDAWMARLEPRDEFERYLVERAVRVSWQLDRIDRAQAARLEYDARGAGAEQTAEDADQVVLLGRRLFWDACGPVCFYPHWHPNLGVPIRISWDRDIEDPNEPARVLNRLESTPLGCTWLLDRWDELGTILDDDLKWQPPDRLKAVRMLGKQPLDAAADERVASIYLACYAMDPVEGKAIFGDVASELHGSEGDRFDQRIDARKGWDRQPESPEAGLELLQSLVAGEVERLEAVLALHLEREEVARPDRFGFEDTREGEQLRRYQIACNRTLLRILDMLRKYRREAERAEGQDARGQKGRGVPRSPRPPEPSPLTGPVVADLLPSPHLGDSIDQGATRATGLPTLAVDSPSPVAMEAADPPPEPIEASTRENSTNEATTPGEGGSGAIRATVLAVLALLCYLGLSAAFAVSKETAGTSPSPQMQGDAHQTQVLTLKQVLPTNRLSPRATAPRRSVSRSRAERAREASHATLERCRLGESDHPAWMPIRPSGPPPEAAGPEST